MTDKAQIESREAAVPPKNDLPSHSGHTQPRLSQLLEEPLCLECRYHHTEEEDCIDWRDDPAEVVAMGGFPE